MKNSLKYSLLMILLTITHGELFAARVHTRVCTKNITRKSNRSELHQEIVRLYYRGIALKNHYIKAEKTHFKAIELLMCVIIALKVAEEKAFDCGDYESKESAASAIEQLSRVREVQKRVKRFFLKRMANR